MTINEFLPVDNASTRAFKRQWTGATKQSLWDWQEAYENWKGCK